MMEPCCAVCGKTKITDLLMFNYGTCLCNSCAEIAAQSFIRDIAERKLKESEKKKEFVDVEGMSKQEYESMVELKDEIAKKIWDEITEKIKKKREADAKKMAKSSEEIGKVIFVERDCQPGSFNPYKAMYRNRLEKFRNLMGKYKKLMMEYNNAISGQESLIVRLADAQCDVNRYQKRYDELCEEFRIKYKVCNTWMLVASAASLLVGVALGYGLQ